MSSDFTPINGSRRCELECNLSGNTPNPVIETCAGNCVADDCANFACNIINNAATLPLCFYNGVTYISMFNSTINGYCEDVDQDFITLVS